jgi:hypothetical protein
LHLLYVWDRIWIPRKRKLVYKTLKERTAFQVVLYKKFFSGWGEVGNSGAPSRGAGATSEPDVEVSAKDRDEPVVRNLPEAKHEETFRELAVLTQHCREPAVLAHLQEGKV